MAVGGATVRSALAALLTAALAAAQDVSVSARRGAPQRGRHWQSHSEAEAGAADGLSFVTLGDWGGAALGGDSAYAPATVKAVAGQMAKTMTDRQARFVVNTGDNFYW